MGTVGKAFGGGPGLASMSPQERREFPRPRDTECRDAGSDTHWPVPLLLDMRGATQGKVILSAIEWGWGADMPHFGRGT